MGDVESREQNHLPFGKNSTLSSTINTEKNIFISILKFREANNFQIGAVSGEMGCGNWSIEFENCFMFVDWQSASKR